MSQRSVKRRFSDTQDEKQYADNPGTSKNMHLENKKIKVTKISPKQKCDIVESKLENCDKEIKKYILDHKIISGKEFQRLDKSINDCLVELKEIEIGDESLKKVRKEIIENAERIRDSLEVKKKQKVGEIKNELEKFEKEIITFKSEQKTITERDYTRINEEITSCLLELDKIKTEDESLRKFRKEMADYADRISKFLESAHTKHSFSDTQDEKQYANNPGTSERKGKILDAAKNKHYITITQDENRFANLRTSTYYKMEEHTSYKFYKTN